MKQLLRKLIALTLALLLTFAAFPFNLVEMPVFAATSGTTGSCRWSVENSVLTISGNGAMGNYDYTYASDYTTLITSAPWGTNIKAVVIEEGVTTVGKYAFFGCSKIASVSLPDSLITIRESAFRDCEFLYSVTIPDRVTKVEPFAFRGCLSLTSITIGESVTDFGNTGIVLTDCPSLTSIIVNGDNPLFSSKGNCLINTVEKRLVLGCKNSVIPSDGSVKIVGDSAFGGCSSLQSIVIPEGITRIAAQAFYGCTSLS
ncbi:MAG: leucine-rich repeat domain-containing protein, partial [Clostridia bacterium]|nr:leucine-rich repeat domain-containing protein [Clostridia bacterium]